MAKSTMSDLATPDGAGMATVIGRNFSFRLAGQVLSAAINVAAMTLLGNTLAARGYGEYVFWYALVPMIGSLSDLGIGVIVTREIARDPARGRRTLGDALMIKGAVSVALLIAAGVTAPIFFDPATALLVVLITATALVDFGQDVGIWVARGHDRQDLEALLLLLSQVVRLAGLGLCAVFHASLPMFLATTTVAFGLRMLAGGWVAIARFGTPIFAPNWARLRHLVREGLPFGLAMLAVVVYGRVGVLLLKGMATDADVAFFNVGYMLSQPLGFISSAFSVSAFPSLSRVAVVGPSAVRPVLRRAVKFQLISALPLTVGLFALADRIVPILLKGADFAQAGVALQVMSVGFVFIFLNLMARYVLTALDSQRTYFLAILAGLVVNVAVSLLLIGRYGAAGACAALIAGELTVVVICAAALAKYLPLADWWREVPRPLAAALAMGLVVNAFREANLVVVAAAGALVYSAMLIVVRALSVDELRTIRGIYVSFRLPGSAYLARAGKRS
jgi:O-antigen/teichoic acid export membrane protein